MKKVSSLLALLLTMACFVGCQSKENSTNEAAETQAQPAVAGPTEGTHNGYEWVDLGLPSGLKWATCNLGATAAELPGDYYAWGETEVKNSYNENNSKTSGQELGDISGNAEYDAARANWGEGWRMPTKDEFVELMSECELEWIVQDEYDMEVIKLCKFTGPNGNSIIIPAAGKKYQSKVTNIAGRDACYWVSTPDADDADCAHRIYIKTGYYQSDVDLRIYGFPIRPVLN